MALSWLKVGEYTTIQSPATSNLILLRSVPLTYMGETGMFYPTYPTLLHLQLFELAYPNILN